MLILVNLKILQKTNGILENPIPQQLVPYQLAFINLDHHLQAI